MREVKEEGMSSDDMIDDVLMLGDRLCTLMNVEPVIPSDDAIVALMVIGYRKGEGKAPIGISINYDRENRFWSIHESVAVAERMPDNSGNDEEE